MKDVERAYLAGFFDGEGCAAVIYSQYKKKTKKGEKLYSNFGVHLAISNVDQSVLRDVRLSVGKGGIYHQKNVYSFRSTKPTDIIKIIGLIKPYVRVKKQDLKNLEDAAKFILEVRGSKTRHRWMEGEKQKFLEFVDQSKALKGGGRRGRHRKYHVKQ